MAIIHWSPYRNMLNCNHEMANLFDDFFSTTRARGEGEQTPPTWAPDVDLMESKDGYTLRAELPGVSKEDVKVTLAEAVLTLSGEKKFEQEVKNENFHRSERVYGKFSRSFRLPHPIDADKIQAEYRDGVLTLTVPKAESAKFREIEIK
jgi:HSP20 family protein